jgi:site-specific recombinase XerD
MTPLRKRMSEYMQLKHYSASTIKAFMGHGKLSTTARYLHVSRANYKLPDLIGPSHDAPQF